jgi:hypothetical protein
MARKRDAAAGEGAATPGPEVAEDLASEAAPAAAATEEQETDQEREAVEERKPARRRRKGRASWRGGPPVEPEEADLLAVVPKNALEVLLVRKVKWPTGCWRLDVRLFVRTSGGEPPTYGHTEHGLSLTRAQWADLLPAVVRHAITVDLPPDPPRAEAGGLLDG